LAPRAPRAPGLPGPQGLRAPGALGDLRRDPPSAGLSAVPPAAPASPRREAGAVASGSGAEGGLVALERDLGDELVVPERSADRVGARRAHEVVEVPGRQHIAR